jgi:hypothetical protein
VASLVPEPCSLSPVLGRRGGASERGGRWVSWNIVDSMGGQIMMKVGSSQVVLGLLLALMSSSRTSAERRGTSTPAGRRQSRT